MRAVLMLAFARVILLAGLSATRLVLVGTARTEALQGANPLRQMLLESRRLRTVRVVTLGPLSRAGTDRVAAAVAGAPLTADASDRVWVRSGGNPFLIGELARTRGGPADRPVGGRRREAHGVA